MSLPPVGLIVVRSPIITKTKDILLSSLKLLGIVFFSGIAYLVFELASFCLSLCSYRYFLRVLGEVL